MSESRLEPDRFEEGGAVDWLSLAVFRVSEIGYKDWAIYEWFYGREDLNAHNFSFFGIFHPHTVCEPYRLQNPHDRFLCKWCGAVV